MNTLLARRVVPRGCALSLGDATRVADSRNKLKTASQLPSFCLAVTQARQYAEYMDDRPFEPGDIVDLEGQRGTAMIRETNGLLLVVSEDREERWTADHCKLVLRPRP